jgi:bifunctional UDP-N-acetylglucosamine pyrophosphorylase/glucosamine-1-phosphate N-acetyltransferase
VNYNNEPTDNSFHAIVLAAGKGRRMGIDMPKVLLPICGRPMIEYVLEALAGVPRIVIVISRDGGTIRETLGDAYAYAVQEEQLGSGDAVRSAREAAKGSEHVVVMCGDSPLFRSETVRALMDRHVAEDATITLTSAFPDDPHGYGRILRNADGSVCGIAEEKMATEEQKAVREVNGGCYAFNSEWLWDNIELMTKNEAGEYCLTEMVDIAIRQGKRVVTVSASPDEIKGANTPAQLAEAEALVAGRRPL